MSADGKFGVVTREGASNRKNGIVLLDTSDPAHPKVASEYTETVSGGVHSAYIDGHYVYLTDDATGSVVTAGGGAVLSPWAGFGVLLVWVLAVAVAASVLVRRRDV